MQGTKSRDGRSLTVVAATALGSTVIVHGIDRKRVTSVNKERLISIDPKAVWPQEKERVIEEI